MADAIIVALITLVGNGLGMFFANRSTQVLLGYRIGELEKKVEAHNKLVERTYQLEKDVSVLTEHINTIEKE